MATPTLGDYKPRELTTVGVPQPQPQQTGTSPQATLQPYTATNNLRGTQISPGSDPRVQSNIQQATQAAGSIGIPQYGQVAGTNTQAATDAYGRARSSIGGTSAYSPAAGLSRSMALSSLIGMGAGPNRGQIASDVYSQLVDQSQPAYDERVRQVGQDAARFGRLGSGVTTTRLGDLASERERDLDLSRRALASDAASLSLDDQRAIANARLAGSAQFTNEDLSRAGFGLSRAGAELGLGQTLEGSARADRAEQVGERDFQFGADVTRAGMAGDQARLYQDLADQVYGQNYGYRNELRGERDFQNQMQQQSMQDYINQRTLEEMLMSGEFGRHMDYTNTLLGYGFGG